MAKIYICDDEQVWINQIEHAVSDFTVSSDWEMSILCKSTRPAGVLECLQRDKTLGGIYFLDVILKSEINGIELGAKIRELDSEAVLIFVTTHDELVMDTFRLKLQAADYILKDNGCLSSQINDTLHALELHYGNAARKLSAPRIQLYSGGSYHFIVKDDIYFVESMKNQHKLIVHMKSEIFTVTMPLKEMVKQLGDGFVMCRRGCLINPRHVREADPVARIIIFDNKESCVCSCRTWRAVSERLQMGNLQPDRKLP